MAIPTPKLTGEISNADLHQVLKEKLKGVWWFFSKKPVIYLVDRKYQLTSKSEVERFLKNDKTNLEKYVADFHDCDDFSWTLLGAINAGAWAGIAFGFAFSKTHAFNIFCDGKEVYIIEPQNDMIWKPKDIPKKYKKYFLPVQLVMM